MDEYRIYDRSLVDSEVLTLFAGTPYEISPAADEPEYNAFIGSIKRMCAGRVIGSNPLNYILETVSLRENDLVLEFGVWMGHSVNRIGLAYPKAQVFGFDSFYGLPEDWSGPWIKGSFNVLGHLPRGLPSNVQLVAGWFNESLPAFITSAQWLFSVEKYMKSASKRRMVVPKAQIALLHIDCDLYSSTMTVLNALDEYILPGTIIVFDELMNFVDYEKQEMKALYEYVTTRNVNFEVIGVECIAICQHVAIRIV